MSAESTTNTRSPILRRYGVAVVTAIIAAVLVRLFVLEAYRIPVDSMAPTLLAGDCLFVNKISLLLSKSSIRRGDLVVFRMGNRDFLRRVAALEGETVEVAKGTSITVPANQIYVLSDNPDSGHFQDSRQWGFIPLSDVRGKAWLVWFSRDRSRLFKRLL